MTTSTPQRVYRAVAHYADGSQVQRTFITKRARDGWAKQREKGYPADYGMFDDDRAEIPPAQHVERFVSEPFRFMREV